MDCQAMNGHRVKWPISFAILERIVIIYHEYKIKYKKSFPSGKQTFKMKLPLGGKFDQHSEEYKAKLNSLGIVFTQNRFCQFHTKFHNRYNKISEKNSNEITAICLL